VSETTTEAAWSAFCDRLKAVGERIHEADFPSDPRSRAEGLRHLTRLTTYAVQWFVEFGDPDFPAFHRYDDDVVKWGGPNADNHYLRAKIDPKGTYRIRLDTRGLREVILSTPEGDMQLDRYRVFAERSLAELEVAPDGTLEVLLVPEAESNAGRSDGARNHVPLHPDVDHVLLRLYVTDWESDAAPSVTIERVGNEGRAAGPLSSARVAEGLDRAAEWVERSVVYWRNYLEQRRTDIGENRLTPPRSVPGGAADILYGGGWWHLAPGEGLLVECDRPEARYWSMQLYSTPWFESLDIANRVASLNGEQMQVDDDGRFRLVVSAEDPGIPNWLDTEGRESGLLSYRWIWARTVPVPTARAVPLASLRTELGKTTPAFGAAERRAQIEKRRAGITRRFRR